MATTALAVRDSGYVRGYKAGLAIKKQGHRRSPGIAIPVAVVAGFVPLFYGAWQRYESEGGYGAVKFLQRYGTGWDPVTGKWNFGDLLKGVGHIMVGFLVHKVVGGQMGVNRFLARNKIPLIRI